MSEDICEDCEDKEFREKSEAFMDGVHDLVDKYPEVALDSLAFYTGLLCFDKQDLGFAVDVLINSGMDTIAEEKARVQAAS